MGGNPWVARGVERRRRGSESLHPRGLWDDCVSERRDERKYDSRHVVECEPGAAPANRDGHSYL